MEEEAEDNSFGTASSTSQVLILTLPPLSLSLSLSSDKLAVKKKINFPAALAGEISCNAWQVNALIYSKQSSVHSLLRVN